MSPTVTTIDQIDHEISLAFAALGVARGSYTHCPSAENARLVDEAEGAVDRLLDERLVVSR
jgi:hypothetical protein